jgi:hypothetical protein
MSKEHDMVESLCRAHGTSIEGVFFKAVHHFYEVHENELLAIRPATKAALINDYIYQYLQEELENTGLFEFIEKPKGRFIGYDSKILIRIKKLNKARKPAVNKTHAANQFNTQGDMELINNAGVSNVYLGYVLNHKSGNVDQIAFAYPNKAGVIAWTVNIEGQVIQRTLDLEIASSAADEDGSGNRKGSRFTPKMPKRKQG